MNLLSWLRRDPRPGGQKALSPVTDRGWFSLLREPYQGAWQRNAEESFESVVAYGPAFACITRIASDIAKLRLRLVAKDQNGIWTEAENASYSPVLRRPNKFQNRIQFIENWLISKLTRGNTYALKVKDGRNVVTGLYILNPDRVTPLVADDGSVFYRLVADNLAGLTGDDVIVPADWIIHDRVNCLFHPLVGLSPIFAAAVAAGQGLKIQRTSSNFFDNAARPSGVLTAPAEIEQATADRLKAYWETEFGGDEAGKKIAVLGDGLKFEAMTMTSDDAQLIEQLKWTAETVCACFHVPAFMVGYGQAPTYNNVEAIWQLYYSQCLQIHIEGIELCLDEGLALSSPFGTEFDLDDLLRMDTKTQYEVLKNSAGILTLDEQRRKVNAPPLKKGGATVYLQQQDHSVEAIAARDEALIANGGREAPAPMIEPPTPANDDGETERQAAAALEAIRKGLSNAI